MSAGAPVLASDLPAFVRVLDGGSAGATFINEDPRDLARRLLELLSDGPGRQALAARGRKRADVFDWSVVAADVMAVYETVTDGASRVRPAADSSSRWTRLLRSGRAPLG